MSLEKIEQYMKELEAIKSYEHVKRERDVLVENVEHLEAEVSKLKQSLESERSLTGKLKEELKERTNEAGELNKRVMELSSETSSLSEVAKFVGDEKLTLPQLRDLIAKVKAEEIRAEAGKLFNELKSSWEKNEKPAQVFRDACIALAGIIELLKKPEPRYTLRELIDLGLPSKVEKMLAADVERRVDEEFRRSVKIESDRKAAEKLEALKRIEWPAWFSSNVQPKISENVFKMLQGPWEITCDKCGAPQPISFTAQGISDLLRDGDLKVDCVNPSCNDGWARHKIRIGLAALILHRITIG